MGQKVNPIGMRLGINKTWDSKWYANTKDYAKMLNKDLKLREYLEEKLARASVSKVEVDKNNKRFEIVIHTAKPGIVIGRGGEEINKLKEEIKKILDDKNVEISIVDIKKPELNATLVAQSIAHQIQNRASYKSAQKRAIRNARRAGAKGVKTQVAGRLGGVEMARSEGYSEGTIPLHTLRADIDYSAQEADTSFGKIGVKVWIYKGEILDKNSKGGN